MGTADLSDPKWAQRVNDALFGTSTTPGVVELAHKHERQIYGVQAEGFDGMLRRLKAVEDALFSQNGIFAAMAKRVEDMDSGRKYVITLLTIGASSLPGLASLVGVIILLVRLITGQPTGNTP